MAINIVYSVGAKIIQGKTPNDTIEFDVIETPLIEGATRTPFINFDINYDVVIPTVSKNNAVVVPTNLPIEVIANGVSSNDAIATISNPELKIEWVADGAVEFYVGANGWGEKRIIRTMKSDSTDSFLDATSFVAGTLSEHIQEQVDALINGLTPGDNTQKFWAVNNYNVALPNATRNPNLFTGNLDFSGIVSMQSDEVDDRYAYALISNRHAVAALHIIPLAGVGNTVVFKRTDGTFQTAIVDNVTAVTRLLSDNVSLATPDLAIVHFDRDITGCAIYKTMPPAFSETYCKSTVEIFPVDGGGLSMFSAVPVIRKTMHDLNGAWESYLQINHLISSGYITEEVIPYNFSMGFLSNVGHFNQQTIQATTWDWGINGIAGDSGSPSFLLINGELILLCSQWNEGSSPDISFWEPEVNEIMNTQAGTPPGTFSLVHPDLSEFTTF